MNFQREFVFRFRLLIGCGCIISYRLVFINVQKLSIRTNKALVEDAAREPVKTFLFKSLKMAAGDFSGFGDFIQRYAAHFAFTPQPVAKSSCLWHWLALFLRLWRHLRYLAHRRLAHLRLESKYLVTADYTT